MHRFRSFILSFIALCAASAAPAMALDLTEARMQQLVGETANGYVEAIGSGHEISELVASVNAQRTQAYADIAKEKGQSVSVVAKVASEQIIKGLKPGMRYKDTNGTWHTR